jgi:hypothetical protein
MSVLPRDQHEQTDMLQLLLFLLYCRVVRIGTHNASHLTVTHIVITQDNIDFVLIPISESSSYFTPLGNLSRWDVFPLDIA